MKRSITLAAGTEQTRIALVKQLKEYIDDVVFIKSYAIDEGIDGIIKDDLIILSSELVRNELLESKLLDESCESIVAQRVISYDHVDEIVLLPQGMDVVFVNDVPQTTYEGIENLKEIGIDYVNFIPYFPGIKGAIRRADIAITPGEVDKVPSFVKKIYDIGPRNMDFTTITKILDKLNILDERAGQFSQKYLKKIINIAKSLAKSNNRISELNNHLNLVIDGLNEGLLVYDGKSNISVFNENLKKILKIRYSIITGKSLKDVIYNKNLLEFLTDNSMAMSKIFNVNGLEILVNKFYLTKNDTVITSFKSVKETIEANEKLRRELVKKGFYAKYALDDIVGESEKIIRTKDIAKKLAKTELTILIEGESGTGKELFASAIHNQSKRSRGPFLAVNFSAISDDLIESELFGYEEGAFTGAKKGGKAGLFEQADGGTIFLDEIGDISMKVQARLLRVLQEKEVMRVGGNRIKYVDVRIVAATNKSLVKMVKEKSFREDLYYRLKMGYIKLPPLRVRKTDIKDLMNYFIKVETTEDIKISEEVMDELIKYDWYGNVRELKNTLTYMLAVKEGDILTTKDIPHKGFFQGVINNDVKYREVKEKKYLDEELKFILKQIYELDKKGHIVGRERLSEATKGTKYEMTKYQMRSRLDRLERLGLIIKKKGKHGTILNHEGKKILMGLNIEMGD